MSYIAGTFVYHQMHSTTWLNCFNWLHKKKHQLWTTNLCEGKVSSYTSAVTLASVHSQKSLDWAHCIRKATRISKIVKETTNAIWKVLKEVYLKPPQEVAVWKTISKEFENLWNFPHCIEAIDGKHVATKCPNLSGTQYFNYKGFFSVVLIAICDAKYCFTYVDFGQYGSTNNSSVLRTSS